MAHDTAQPNEGIVLREDRGAITVITLNRPAARNCLSEDLMAAVGEQVGQIAASQESKAVIIAANGPVFCSGHDIRELENHRGDGDGGKDFFARMFAASSDLMRAIVNCPKPVIAAVEGTATAAGCQLVATCDLAVAGEDVKFCTPGVHIGLFCSTPAVALARNVGRKRAMEMLLLGEMIGAREARDAGLVNRVAPRERVMAEAMKMAETIASKSSAAISLGKKTFNEQVQNPLGEAYDTASRAMVENMMLADAHEGLSAFLEKREPLWRDA